MVISIMMAQPRKSFKPKACPTCRTRFRPNSGSQIYCSAQCRAGESASNRKRHSQLHKERKRGQKKYRGKYASDPEFKDKVLQKKREYYSRKRLDTEYRKSESKRVAAYYTKHPRRKKSE